MAARWAATFRGGLQAKYGDLGFTYVLVGYIPLTTLTCTDLHDFAEAEGWLGRVTMVADDRLDIYRDLLDESAGVPQVVILDRWMRVRAHRSAWDPSRDPPYYEGVIETLLAE